MRWAEWSTNTLISCVAHKAYIHLALICPRWRLLFFIALSLIQVLVHTRISSLIHISLLSNLSITKCPFILPLAHVPWFTPQIHSRGSTQLSICVFNSHLLNVLLGQVWLDLTLVKFQLPWPCGVKIRKRAPRQTLKRGG